LKEKIEIIENLKKQFFESLEMEIKFSSFWYQSYQEELKKNNLNSFIVKNLENYINFYVPELNINKENSLKDRINEIISYLNQNINSKFQNLDIKNEKENESIDTNIDYHLKTSINFEAKGFFEYNKSLFVLYNDDIIKFFNKENFD
jgi:hypothetical protein